MARAFTTDSNSSGPGRHWFVSPTFDLSLFHGPVWLCWLIVFLLPERVRELALPTWVWVSVVLVIDVGHVWSSIYRTYLDPTARQTHKLLLRWLPLLCFAPLFMLALHSDGLFWRVLAYIAVFHFIKQQVGVAALYRYKSLQGHALDSVAKTALARADKLTVYAGTICPVIFWHFSPQRSFHWFIPGDFLGLDFLADWIVGLPGGAWLTASAILIFKAFWFGSLAYWLLTHLYYKARLGLSVPLGKGLWIVGTWINWYLGIVYFDSDLVFTLTNVVAHGAPYYGLIGLYGYRKLKSGGYGAGSPRLPKRLSAQCALIAVFFLAVLALALGEEYLWSFLIYRDHAAFFEAGFAFPIAEVTTPFWRAFFIAALSLPQVVHYLLDGFIWKFNNKNPDLKTYLLPAD